MAVVDETEDAVDRSVGVGEIDLGQDGGDALIAAGVTGENGREELGSDLREVSGGRRRNEGRVR
jgi:hypothetical protein